jgi:hypothetical protein
MTRSLFLLFVALCPILVGQAAAQDKFEIRYAMVAYGTKRNATLEDVVGRASGLMTGGEISLDTRLARAAARLIGGSFAADSGVEASGGVAMGDARLNVGPRAISGEVGYSVRALSGNYGTRRWTFYRVGIRSTLPLGASGFHASASAAFYLNVRGSGVPGTGSGKEAETRLTYIVPKLPIFLMVGYRLEGFTVNAARNTRPEELSGLLLGGGVRLGR